MMRRLLPIALVACTQQSAPPPSPAPNPDRAPAIAAPTATAIDHVIVSRSGHACARTRDAKVVCWGRFGADDPVLRPTVLAGLDHAVGIATGAWDTCAWRDDGTVACEEYRAQKPTAIAGLDHVVELAADQHLTCARHGGKVACWSLEVGHQAFVRAAPRDVPGLDDAAQIAVAANMACARRRAGEVVCWTGDGAPAVVAGAAGALTIAGGGGRFAAVLPGGKTFGWDDEGKPWALPAAADVTRVAVGVEAACVAGKTVTCATDNVVSELPALVGATEITVDNGLGCARMADGHVRCWGYIDRIGIGEPLQQRTPVEVAGIDDGVELAGTGSQSTCVRRASGRVACWGHKLLGKLAYRDESLHYDYAPVDIGLEHVTELDLGYATACARQSDGKLACWGDHGTQSRWESPAIVARRPLEVSHGPPSSWGGGWQRMAWSCRRRGKGVSCTEHFSGRHEGTDSGDWHDETYDHVTDIADLLIPRDSTDAPFVLHTSGVVEMEDGGWKQVLDGVAELVHGPADEHGNATICARLRTGSVTCWQGSSASASHDLGITDAVQLIGTAQQLGGRACVLRKSGRVVCWGDRDSIGDGHGVMVTVPAEVPGLLL